MSPGIHVATSTRGALRARYWAACDWSGKMPLGAVSHRLCSRSIGSRKHIGPAKGTASFGEASLIRRPTASNFPDRFSALMRSFSDSGYS